jgi:hypothetical protein
MLCLAEAIYPSADVSIFPARRVSLTKARLLAPNHGRALGTSRWCLDLVARGRLHYFLGTEHRILLPIAPRHMTGSSAAEE